MHTGVVENEQQKTKTLSVSLPWNRLFLLHSAPKPRALGVRETEKEKEKKRRPGKVSNSLVFPQRSNARANRSGSGLCILIYDLRQCTG